MSVALTSASPALQKISPLERAILETLAYSDIFDYPLTLAELHRYLTISASQSEITNCLRDMPSVSSSFDDSRYAYYYLSQHPEVVEIRKAREIASRRAFRRALFYGRILGILPFVRMVAMTGSLAVLNLSQSADMDYMLVTAPGRLWIARAFAVTLGRLVRLFGDRICVNLLVSENALQWSLHDLYSAREVGQMIPIVGQKIYCNFRAANPWVDSILPNAGSAPGHAPTNIDETGSLFQKILELTMPGAFGTWLNVRVMNFQLRKISKQYGKGAETNFTTDVCQGNFHDHRKWTGEFFHARLASLGLVSDEALPK